MKRSKKKPQKVKTSVCPLLLHRIYFSRRQIEQRWFQAKNSIWLLTYRVNKKKGEEERNTESQSVKPEFPGGRQHVTVGDMHIIDF